MTPRKALVSAMMLLATLGSADAAMARTAWQQHHPARTRINHRLANQQRRITAERKEGELTKAQAQSLRSEDRAIRQQERADARANHNHGHLNRAQIRTLNQELNANSKAIGH